MTVGRYRLRPQAQDDIVAIARYIAKDSPAAAERFIRATEETCEQLATLPRSGAKRTFRNQALAGIRMMPVREFEACLAFYLPDNDGIDVVRIIHGARDLPRLFS